MNFLEDRRNEHRLADKTIIFVELCSATADNTTSPNIIICTSLDISANGIQIQMDKEVPVASILRLCADFGNEREPIYLVGEAKWVKPEGELFNIGFELLDAENSDFADWKYLVASKLLNT